MDKARKLAGQAQQKLDQAQQNFKEGGSTAGQPGADAAPAPEQPASEQPTHALAPDE